MPTPAEVCQKAIEAKTPGEAKEYVTDRFYPVSEFCLADKTPSDPHDTFNITQEKDDAQAGVKLVAFHGLWFLPELGKRVRVEGHFRVVRKLDRWAVDDMLFSGVDGSSLPSPMSVVDELKRTGAKPKAANSSTTPQTDQSKSKNYGIFSIPIGIVQAAYNRYGLIGGILVAIAIIVVVCLIYTKW